MSSNLNIEPITNPLECHGYPKGWTRKEPQQEFNFFLLPASNSNSKIPAPKKRNGCCITNDSKIELTDALSCSLIPNNNGNNDTSLFSKSPLPKKELMQELNNIDRSKPIIIICHGLLSWRNQMLISNLASELSSSRDIEAHTLRFDFMASGHSSGIWKFANYLQDYRDLCRIVKFVQDDLQCTVACIIGHSQSAAAVIQYASEHDDDKQHQHTCYVNLAGRYLLPNDFDPGTVFDQQQCRELERQRFFNLIKRGESGMNRSLQVRQEDVNNRNAFDISMKAKRIKRSRVLTIHGDADVTVPVQDAHKFEKAILNHTVLIFKGAGHNFNGLRFMVDLVPAISTFMQGQ